jgi:hypothetical protein
MRSCCWVSQIGLAGPKLKFIKGLVSINRNVQLNSHHIGEKKYVLHTFQYLTSTDPYSEAESTNRLLALPEGHQAKNILPATLTNGPQETSDPEFTPTRRRTNGADLGTRLAKSIQTAIGENNRVETITDTPISVKGNVTIKDRDAAADDGKRASSTTGSIFTDGCRMDSGYTGCSVVWRQTNREWRKERYNLGKRKEMNDAELYAIAEAVSLAYRRNI